ncbi:MAG: hypothetical protein L3J04_00395 [Robiginitomaculum sp.]|nr:hypothetical protein [Robiginitomaculum sp.]
MIGYGSGSGGSGGGGGGIDDTGRSGGGTGCTTNAKGGAAIVATAAAFARGQGFLDANTSVNYVDYYAAYIDFGPIMGKRMELFTYEPKRSGSIEPIDGRFYPGPNGGSISIFRGAISSGPFVVNLPDNVIQAYRNLSAYEKAIMTVGHESGHSKLGLSAADADQEKADQRGVNLLKVCRGG